jgi:CBS domain-containing protein
MEDLYFFFLQDVSGRVIAEGLKPEETNAAKVMTRNPVFVEANSSATDALQKMVQGLLVIFLHYQN